MKRWIERFWVFNAVFLGIWEGYAVGTHRILTISNTTVCARKRWPRRTLVFLLSWAVGLVTYLYTKEEEAE